MKILAMIPDESVRSSLNDRFQARGRRCFLKTPQRDDQIRCLFVGSRLQCCSGVDLSVLLFSSESLVWFPSWFSVTAEEGDAGVLHDARREQGAVAGHHERGASCGEEGDVDRHEAAAHALPCALTRPPARPNRPSFPRPAPPGGGETHTTTSVRAPRIVLRSRRALTQPPSLPLQNEILFTYAYPRLDVEVSKHMNHLLKAPFCVHPKTGRLCVPIDPATAEDFDPLVRGRLRSCCR